MRKKHALAVVKMVDALKSARAEIKDTLEVIGGCDHSVGICCCSVYRLLDQIDAAVKAGEAAL